MMEDIKKEEIIEMVKAAKEYDITKCYKRYLSPDIPEKIINKIQKYFDISVEVHGIVAFYDSTVTVCAKRGIVLTNDGFYIKSLMEKPLYIPYIDIADIIYESEKSSEYLNIQLINGDIHRISDVLDMRVLKDLLFKLKEIDEIYGQTSFKGAGTIEKIEIPENIKKKCHTIIHSAATAAGAAGAGLAQAIGSDNLVITPIQITMITTLGKVFDLHITEGMAKGIIASAGASIVGRTASQILVGWIPVIGNVINTTTAAGITEAIGWIAVDNFYRRWLDEKNKGRLDGKKEGYQEASGEYERKLRKQAEEFINQMRDYKIERDAYEKLLTEYENYIDKLEKENASLSMISDNKKIYSELKDLDQ